MRHSNTTRTNTFASVSTLTGCGTMVVALAKRTHQALYCAGVHLMRLIAVASDGIQAGGRVRLQPVPVANSPASDRKRASESLSNRSRRWSWSGDEARPSQF